MKYRINKEGDKVYPHAIKLEEKYNHMFDWFKEDEGKSKTDVIKDAVVDYFISHGGDIEEIKSKCTTVKQSDRKPRKKRSPNKKTKQLTK